MPDVLTRLAHVVYTRPKIRRLGCVKPRMSMPSQEGVTVRFEIAAAGDVLL